MKLRSASLAFAFVAISLQAVADTNKFDLISSNGKNVGRASYSISKTKTGYNVHSTFDVQVSNGGVNDMPLQQGVAASRGGSSSYTDVQYSYDYKLGPDGSFLSGYALATITQTMIPMSVNKARTEITISQSRSGTVYGSQTVTLTKPDFLVIPNYDPGAIQAFITASLTNPRPDNKYLVLIPFNPDVGQSDNTAGFVTLKSEPDAKGTLDGKPIDLKHYSVEFRAGKTDIYTDGSGTVMQVVMGALHNNYVRSKFVLTPAS